MSHQYGRTHYGKSQSMMQSRTQSLPMSHRYVEKSQSFSTQRCMFIVPTRKPTTQSIRHSSSLSHSSHNSMIQHGSQSIRRPTVRPSLSSSYSTMTLTSMQSYSRSMRHFHSYSGFQSMQSQPLPKSYYQRSYHSMAPPMSHRYSSSMRQRYSGPSQQPSHRPTVRRYSYSKRKSYSSAQQPSHQSTTQRFRYVHFRYF